jgi:DNA-binding FadR family transcriptional regulator
MAIARAAEPAPRRRSATGPNLTAGMLNRLGRAIVTGCYEDRRFPTEGDLARQHGVSRCVTREAVKMLTAKGLLSARPRSGTIVQPASSWNLFDPDVLRWLLQRQFSLELLRHFTQLRIAIEPAAAALAAEAGDAEAICAVRSAYRAMEAAEAGEGDPHEADIAFHVAVLDASGNPFYRQTRDVVATALQTSIPFSTDFKGRTASLPAHRAVLEAIEAGEGARAREAMTAIVADVLDLIAEAEALA